MRSGRQETEQRDKRHEDVEDIQPDAELAEQGEEITEDLDQILDEIDEILEEDSEEFVDNYIQRGGE